MRKEGSLEVPTLTPYFPHALLHRCHSRPQEGEKNEASRYLRSRPTTLTPYYIDAIDDHRKEKRVKPQGTYAHVSRPTTVTP